MALIIDDQQINFKLLKRKFERYGFDVVATTDPSEGMKLARKHIPDIILLDVKMPKIDGFRLARMIREDESTKDCLIMFVTARLSKEAKLEAFRVGGNDYVTKSVDLDEVTARATALCRTSKLIKSYNIML